MWNTSEGLDEAATHQSRNSSKRQLIKAATHQNSNSSKQQLIKAATHQSGNSSNVVIHGSLNSEWLTRFDEWAVAIHQIVLLFKFTHKMSTFSLVFQISEQIFPRMSVSKVIDGQTLPPLSLTHLAWSQPCLSRWLQECRAGFGRRPLTLVGLPTQSSYSLAKEVATLDKLGSTFSSSQQCRAPAVTMLYELWSISSNFQQCRATAVTTLGKLWSMNIPFQPHVLASTGQF